MKPQRLIPLALLTLSALSLSACASVQQVDAQASAPAITSQATSPEASPSPAAEESAPQTPTEETQTTQDTADQPPAEEEAAPSPSQLTPPVNDGFTIDAASLVTTDLVAGEPVVSLEPYQFEAADQPSLVFQTPEPHIACLMQPYGVFCLTDDSKNWVLQSVSMAPGDSQPRTVQARGRAATHDWFKNGQVLAEGQSLTWMGMTCTSTGPASVQCQDGTLGFNLSNLEDR